MQREALNIEARELIEDDSIGVKQQGSERPLSPKKRRLPVETESGFQSGEQFDLDAESNHERFKDLALPSSQSCLERESLYVSIASSDEDGDEADGEEEELKQQAEATSLVQGGDCGREEDETDTQGPGSELVQVAPNMEAGGSHPPGHNGPGVGQRAARDPSDGRVSGATRKKTRRQDGRGGQKAGEAGKRELSARRR